jgi:DNA-binding PadR family transcriptional regulator
MSVGELERVELEKIASRRRTNTPATRDTSRQTLRHIILGFLGIRPMTGYDIKTTFDRSIASYWNASHSQIYSTLKALQAEGLVTSEVVYQESRPNRRVYRLTARGEAELRRWLAEPVPDRFTKDEFLAKLFFCGESSDQTALSHLLAHRQAVRDQLAHLEAARAKYACRPVRRPHLLEFQMLVLEYKESMLRADLEVTERALQRLQERLGVPAGTPNTAQLNPEVPTEINKFESHR